MKLNLEYAKSLDHQDSLAKYKSLFNFPKLGANPTLYFCGHSLGLAPIQTKDYVEQALNDWAEYGVLGHHQGQFPFLPYHEFVTETLAGLVGGSHSEVVAMNSLTTNLHLLFTHFFRPQSNRKKILIESQAFSSDYYAVCSQLHLHGLDPQTDLIEWQVDPLHGYQLDSLERILKREGKNLNLIFLGGVNYLNGQLLPIDKLRGLVEKYTDNRCLIGLDLAHAVGNVILKLHDWDIDFAMWCHYKYLNAGPGSIGGAFVHQKHLNFNSGSAHPALQGWWGFDKKSRFQMPKKFQPIESVEAFQLSNPPILQLAALRSSLDLFQKAGIQNLREKAILMGEFFYRLLAESKVLSKKITLLSPADVRSRGCQISIRPQAGLSFNENLVQQLTQKGIIIDFRRPDILRLAPVPLYNSFEDVWNLVVALEAFI